jgi:hypothetical protein
MPSARELRRLRRARRRTVVRGHRGRRIAGLTVLVAVAAVSLVLTAFGSGAASPSAAHVAAAAANPLLPGGPPEPQTLAVRGQLHLQLPVSQSRVTAIGYHDAGGGALLLEPQGTRGNRGIVGRLVDRIFGRGDDRLVWYQLSDGETSSLDVGAAAGTDTFSPVDGTVIGIADLVIDGRARGVRIDIQPAAAPSLVVSVSRLRPDPSLTVGSAVVAASSRLGAVLDLSALEQQELARYTHDAGNNVAVQVRPAPTLTLS